MQFLDRHDFTIFTLPLSGKNSAGRIEDAVHQLLSLYPVPVSKEQIQLRKDRKSRNWIVAVYRKRSYIPAGKLSTWYILDSLPLFTGKVFFRVQHFTEICLMKNGALIESSCVDESTTSLEGESASAGAVFLSSEFYTSFKKNGNNRYIYELPLLLPSHSAKQIARYAIFGSIFAAIVLGSAYNYKKLQADKKEHQAQAMMLQLQKETEIRKKEKETLCANLYKKYHDLYIETPVEPYAYCSLIYRCLDTTAVVDSLSITSNTFQVDLRSSDAVRILKNFEKQQGLSGCTMNRIAVEQETGRQVYTVSGTAVQELPDIQDSDANKRSEFYQKQISDLEFRRNRLSAMTLSEAVADIRKLMIACGCREEYMQRQINAGAIELDVSIQGTSMALLSFLKKSAGSIIIKNIRIKNYADQNSVSALARIVTYIPENRDENNKIASSDMMNVAPAAISKSFTGFSGVIKRTDSRASLSATVSASRPEKAAWLTCLGTGKTSDGTVFIFIKDTKTGDISKINSFLDSGNGTIQFTGKDGKKYEVVK
jgi:hypothetical protein